jgi:signal peptidase I
MMKNFLASIFEILRIVILALIIVLPIRFFIFQPFVVKGASMEPNFDQGDYLIIDEISYRFREPKRGEVIVFRFPLNPSQRFIKRIVGLPGETVEIKEGKVIIKSGDKVQTLNEKYLPSINFNGREYNFTLKENEYFVLGDNRNFSYDSRYFGPLNKKFIIGRVILRLWPIKNISKIEVPAY